MSQQQQPLLVMWPGGAFPGVPFPLEGGKKKNKTRSVKRKAKKTRKARKAGGKKRN